MIDFIIWNNDNRLGKNPASTTIRHRPVDPEEHLKFAAKIMRISPDNR